MPRKPSPPPTLSPPLSSRRRILHSPSSSTPSAPKPTKRKPRGLHTRLPSGANASKWCELADILDGMVDICSDSSDSSSSSSVNGDGDGAWEEEGDGDGLQAWSGGGKDDDIDVWHPPPPPQRPSGIKIMRAERVPEPEPEPEPELAAAVSPIGHEVFLTTARYQQEVFHRTEVTEVELVREVVVEECGYYRHQYRQHMEAVEFQRTRTTAATETTHLAWNYVRTRVREKMSETVRVPPTPLTAAAALAVETAAPSAPTTPTTAPKALPPVVGSEHVPTRHTPTRHTPTTPTIRQWNG
ncbi:hypothetical protein BZA05DRAFT_419276 [Tricharina praecox]|uniref:uncharacterized protein n=1 Tax=Tricharina praecox TaxID=43433 RepID=UPI00221EAED6|nr:uncharacterized protein BZA05DRAFT_419276 [Tricharina praecox]KAI5850766.1 hypothetical protein BZA05DRAFT_419276 [Tricharina praecox]